MKNFRFYKAMYKEKIRWYVDIRPWIFPKRFLIMYDSAEKWLEKLGKGANEVIIAVSTKNFPNSESFHRTKIKKFYTGSYYIAKTYKKKKANHKILLCMVALYVFGRYPNIIYYKLIDRIE